MGWSNNATIINFTLTQEPQLEYYRHLELDTSFLWRAVLCILGYLEAF